MIAIFIAILCACLTSLSFAGYYGLEHWVCDPAQWINAYFMQARVPMFTGFLTLGSFLLTLQTAIIQRLKEAYDSADYARMVDQIRAKKKDKAIRYYGGLERVGIALATNVILSLITAALQMTLGFFQTTWSTAICGAFAVTTVMLVIYLTIQLVLAHRHWFRKIEAEKTASSARGGDGI